MPFSTPTAACDLRVLVMVWVMMKGGMVMKFFKKVNIITKQWTLLSNKVQELKRIGSDYEIYVS
jgi:hypothetical protein